MSVGRVRSNVSVVCAVAVDEMDACCCTDQLFITLDDEMVWMVE